MQQTLFHIPHSIGGLPVFGFGWALLALLLIGSIYIVCMVRRFGFSSETTSQLPVLALFGAAVVFLLPILEERVWLDGAETSLGLPIRGYGTFVLLGMIAGMAVTVRRASQLGISTDTIYSLAFWMFVCGIVGARIFYVIQKWEEFSSPQIWELIGRVLKLTEGGLVVYGALIGGLIGAVAFLRSRQLSLLGVADLITPGMALGLALGRIGCLMNGCCYGDVCRHSWAVTFPRYSSVHKTAESPPYGFQHRSGQFYGFRFGADDSGAPIVRQVFDASSEIRPGDRITVVNGKDVKTTHDVSASLATSSGRLDLTLSDGRDVTLSIPKLPERSLPVHPTQIYSSINAGLIFLFAYCYFPFRRREGELIAIVLTIYPVTRFLLEIIRTDEGAIFGTGMTISQNVSLLIVAGVVALWGVVLKGGKVQA